MGDRKHWEFSKKILRAKTNLHQKRNLSKHKLSYRKQLICSPRVSSYAYQLSWRITRQWQAQRTETHSKCPPIRARCPMHLCDFAQKLQQRWFPALLLQIAFENSDGREVAANAISREVRALTPSSNDGVQVVPRRKHTKHDNNFPFQYSEGSWSNFTLRSELSIYYRSIKNGEHFCEILKNQHRSGATVCSYNLTYLTRRI